MVKGLKMKYNILVVDDSKTILLGLKQTLEDKLNIDVITATSMKECAQLILEHKGKFDLALLDYGLPDAPNGEIIGMVKKFKIPSIVLTGTQLEKDHEIFQNENLIDYIIKNGSYAIDYSVSVVQRFLQNAQVEVLVVDDSKTFAFKMQNLCKKYNLKTVVANSGEEALQIIPQRVNLKLVLLDYMMPGLNGLEVTQQIRKKYKKDELAIIALSGMSEKDVVASFLKYGANDFLYKDFSNEEFFARVNSNIEVLELFNVTQDKAKRDYLTGLFNKNYLLNAGQEIWERSKTNKELLSVIMFSIDTFRVINESYGHDAGDEAVIELGKILSDNVNKDAIIARMGADQFCILLKNRPYAELYQIFDELRENIANNKFPFDNWMLDYTVSIGINIDLTDSLEEMIYLAEEALENAKYKGGNQIIINS